jgi:hypothetical protein
MHHAWDRKGMRTGVQFIENPEGKKSLEISTLRLKQVLKIYKWRRYIAFNCITIDSSFVFHKTRRTFGLAEEVLNFEEGHL